MLVKVEIQNNQGELLTLPLNDISTGIIVAEIDGLDPVKSTLVSSSFAQQDGAQYHSSRREPRNVKFKFEIDPDWITQTVRDIRRNLYRFFMTKSEVRLRFYMSSGLYVDIYGRVEEFDFPLFTNEPKADISLMCFDPDFYDPNPVQFSGFTTDLTDETLVEYVGSIESGLELTLLPDRDISEFTVYHRPPDGTLRTLDFATPLSAGDSLVISTVSGAKGAYLTRSGSLSSVLYGISPQSNWLELQPGDNYLRVYALGTPIPYSIQYTTRYGGL